MSIEIINKSFQVTDSYKQSMYKRYLAYMGENNQSVNIALQKQQLNNLWVPKTSSIIDVIATTFGSAFFVDDCPITVKPKRMFNDKDVEDSLIASSLVKQVYIDNKQQTEITTAFKESLIYGFSVCAIYYDKKNKKIKLRNLPLSAIAFDYTAKNIKDIKYICYKHTISKQTLQNLKKDKNYKIDEKEESSIEILEYYQQQDDNTWLVKKYIASEEIYSQVKYFLPFLFGFSLAPFLQLQENYETLKDEYHFFGTSLVDKIAPLQKELNYLRNKRLDIINQILNPVPIYNQDVAPSAKKDINSLAPLFVNGDANALKFRPTPSLIEIDNEMRMLNADIEQITGVGSIQMGETNPSDRRAFPSLSLLSSSSNSRIEEMINNFNVSFLYHYSKKFVALCLNNSSDFQLILGNNYSISDNSLNIMTSFGKNINKNTTLANIQRAIQSMQGSNINPNAVEKIYKKYFKLLLGENDSSVDEIFNSNPPASSSSLQSNIATKNPQEI